VKERERERERERQRDRQTDRQTEHQIHAYVQKDRRVNRTREAITQAAAALSI